MSPAHLPWEDTSSTDRPMSLVLRLSNSALAAEKAPSSVVQTGVKSFGCEKRTPQLSPRYSWKLMVPSVVSAVKSGASSPRRIAMSCSLFVGARSRDLDRACSVVGGDEPLHRLGPTALAPSGGCRAREAVPGPDSTTA